MVLAAGRRRKSSAGIAPQRPGGRRQPPGCRRQRRDGPSGVTWTKLRRPVGGCGSAAPAPPPPPPAPPPCFYFPLPATTFTPRRTLIFYIPLPVLPPLILSNIRCRDDRRNRSNSWVDAYGPQVYIEPSAVGRMFGRTQAVVSAFLAPYTGSGAPVFFRRPTMWRTAANMVGVALVGGRHVDRALLAGSLAKRKIAPRQMGWVSSIRLAIRTSGRDRHDTSTNAGGDSRRRAWLWAGPVAHQAFLPSRTTPPPLAAPGLVSRRPPLGFGWMVASIGGDRWWSIPGPPLSQREERQSGYRADWGGRSST